MKTRKPRRITAGFSDTAWNQVRSALHGDAGRLQAFRALFDFIADSLAFGQRLEALAFDSGEVHEHVSAAIRRSDEAKALRFVEPFNGTCSHVTYLKQKNITWWFIA